VVPRNVFANNKNMINTQELQSGDLVQHEESGLGIVMDKAYVETTDGELHDYGWRVSFLNGETFNVTRANLILMNEKEKK